MEMTWMHMLPEPIGTIVRRVSPHIMLRVEEIRIREGRPLELNAAGCCHFIDSTGNEVADPKAAYVATKQVVNRLLDLISNHSLYALEDQLKKGFITTPGGHRVGLVGRAVLDADGKVESLRDINGFNIRIAREMIGIADPLLPYLVEQQLGHVLHTLIVSPPQHGKTTVVRDLIRQISSGNCWIGGHCTRLKVGVVDERSEIAGTYKGVPMYDIGPRTDVMDSCPKAEGMMMMIRSMSPDVLVVDEIGRKEDAHAIMEAIHAGISVIATVHGRELSEKHYLPSLYDLICERRFQRYVLLQRSKERFSFQVKDENMRCITKKNAFVKTMK